MRSKGEVAGKWGGWLTGCCWKKAGSSSKYLSYHAHMHTHNVTDIFPPTAMMSQADSCRKLLASSQPHFSSNGFLSQLHPPHSQPDISPAWRSPILHVRLPFSFPRLLNPTRSPLSSRQGGCARAMKGRQENETTENKAVCSHTRHIFPGDIKEETYRRIYS